MAALVLVPSAAPRAATLYALEEHFAALLDTVELVPAEQEEEFKAELERTLPAIVAKRDSFGHFVQHVEHLIEYAHAERVRLLERQKHYERVLERLQEYGVHVIQSLGVDSKGKYKKLEGTTLTLAARKCPDSAEVKDEAAVPSEFKRLTVRMPAVLFERIADSFDLEERATFLEQVKLLECEVPKAPVKEALQAGIDVPGAKLCIDKYRLAVS